MAKSKPSSIPAREVRLGSPDSLPVKVNLLGTALNQLGAARIAVLDLRDPTAAYWVEKKVKKQQLVPANPAAPLARSFPGVVGSSFFLPSCLRAFVVITPSFGTEVPKLREYPSCLRVFFFLLLRYPNDEVYAR